MSPPSGRGPIGDCPGCGVSVPPSALLVEYDRGDGSVGRFAECPDCQDVIQPA